MSNAVGEIVWPRKTRDIHNHHMDSTIWDDFKFRDDDIVISTWGKSGTTWAQQIVAQLIFKGDPEVQTEQLSPWVDLRVPEKEIKLGELEAQNHRRFFKTHLPVDALVFSPKARYLYIGRDFPDVIWSLHNHLFNATDEFYEMLNETPHRVGPALERPADGVYAFWQRFLKGDAYSFWSFWENTRSWWAVRHLPNVMLLHFDDLKRDLPGEIRRVAEFLKIPIEESRWNSIVEHCSFDWMKKHAELVTPMGGIMWHGGAGTFINKGVNRRWKDVLTEQDIEEYREIALKELGQECANWLASGS